jgi:hypothetical protein
VSVPLQYGIRFSIEAEQNAISIAHNYMEKTDDSVGARDLYNFFFDAAGVLASFPDRYPVEPSDSLLLGYDIRRLLVRRGGRAWHMAYRIENDKDGPIVWIVYIRDARVPLKEDEAERILSNQ